MKSMAEFGVKCRNVCLLFCFLLDRNKGRIAGKFDYEITQAFLNLKSAPKCVSQQHKKKQDQKSFDVQHQFRYSMPRPNDMIHT